MDRTRLKKEIRRLDIWSGTSSLCLWSATRALIATSMLIIRSSSVILITGITRRSLSWQKTLTPQETRKLSSCTKLWSLATSLSIEKRRRTGYLPISCPKRKRKSMLTRRIRLSPTLTESYRRIILLRRQLRSAIKLTTTWWDLIIDLLYWLRN